MGTFEVACVEGCTCNSTIVDGINTIEGDKSSQTVFWLMEVSAAGGWVGGLAGQLAGWLAALGWAGSAGWVCHATMLPSFVPTISPPT